MIKCRVSTFQTVFQEMSLTATREALVRRYLAMRCVLFQVNEHKDPSVTASETMCTSLELNVLFDLTNCTIMAQLKR